tara:strand:- start:1034 stop:1423 length:390 start_codon:yes stop_codon:yes gene_type:complete
MKHLGALVIIVISLMIPSSSLASHIELKPCIQISHCAKEELDVNLMDSPLERIKTIVKSTPRTEIIEMDGDYLHAEVTSKIMKYVDDLEISFSPESKKIIIRSESRVGEGDFGVNQKRVDNIISKYLES